MKKIILISAAAVILTASVNAQAIQASLKSDIQIDKKAASSIKKEKRGDRKELRELKGSEVSILSKRAFASDFNNLPATAWERLDNYDEATFIKDGQVTSAFYDTESQLVGTTQNKTFGDLPAIAQGNINKNYSDYTVGDVSFFDDNELNETDMILYNQQFDDVDSYFVELSKDNKKIVVQVTMDGDVHYFARMK